MGVANMGMGAPGTACWRGDRAATRQVWATLSPHTSLAPWRRPQVAVGPGPLGLKTRSGRCDMQPRPLSPQQTPSLGDGCLAGSLSHRTRVHTRVAVLPRAGRMERRAGLPVPRFPGRGHTQRGVVQMCLWTYWPVYFCLANNLCPHIPSDGNFFGSFGLVSGERLFPHGASRTCPGIIGKQACCQTRVTPRSIMCSLNPRGLCDGWL